jgi:O-glycosyl hydrolase
MTQYIIVPNGDASGFNIAVSGANGARQTILGFGSEAEAEAWIVQDRRLADADEPSPGYQADAND